MDISAKVCYNDAAKKKKKDKQWANALTLLILAQQSCLTLSFAIWCIDTTATSSATNTRGRHSLAMPQSFHREAPTHLNIWPSPLDAPWPASAFLLTSWGLGKRAGEGRSVSDASWRKLISQPGAFRRLTLNESCDPRTERELVHQSVTAEHLRLWHTDHSGQFQSKEKLPCSTAGKTENRTIPVEGQCVWCGFDRLQAPLASAWQRKCACSWFLTDITIRKDDI